MEDIFNPADRRLFVSCFSSSIHRLQLISISRSSSHRRVAIIGRSMTSVTEIAHNLGHLEIPDGFSFVLRTPCRSARQADRADFGHSGRTDVRPFARRRRHHKQVSVEKGDTVVLSSRLFPATRSRFFPHDRPSVQARGDVLYGSMSPPPHVSGHGSIEELRLVLNLVRPRYFMPIHGEFRQMAQARADWRAPAVFGAGRIRWLETGDRLEVDVRWRAEGSKVTVGPVCIVPALLTRSSEKP